MTADKPNELVFQLNDLSVWFPINRGFPKRVVGHVKAVDGVTLDVYRGETLGIVGESGCGKTTLGKAIMQMIRPTGGQLKFRYGDGMTDVTAFKKKDLHAFRKKVQMVFQDPYSALNPMKTVYTALEEPLIIHHVKNRGEREAIMRNTLRIVNIPADYLSKYPHEFSGGQRQRICIARALQISPDVLVCDEAVSALDVSIQAQVLNLLKEIQAERKLTYIFIAHDLSVVQYMSDRIAVMYLGKVVELAGADELYNNTLHPYSKSLLSAVPVASLEGRKERIILKGDVPSPIHKPKGCAFHTRCNQCMDICREVSPELLPYGTDGHRVACHLYTQETCKRESTL